MEVSELDNKWNGKAEGSKVSNWCEAVIIDYCTKLGLKGQFIVRWHIVLDESGAVVKVASSRQHDTDSDVADR